MSDKFLVNQDYDNKVQKAVKAAKKKFFWAKLLHKQLDPSDEDSIQAHPDGQGNYREFYILNPYLQASLLRYSCVHPIVADPQNSEFIYYGLGPLAGAFLASNVSINDIVASPQGNLLFQELLKNSIFTRDKYYEEHNLTPSPSVLNSPAFVLGSLTKSPNGKFSMSFDVSDSAKEKIDNWNNEMQRVEDLTLDSDSPIRGIPINHAIDCWFEQSKNGSISIAGTNTVNMPYTFSIDFSKKLGNMYAYSGNVQIGKTTTVQDKEQNQVRLVQPFTYDNVVLWTSGTSLPELVGGKTNNNKINFALGDFFMQSRLKKMHSPDSDFSFAGGIIINEEGHCKVTDDTPDTIKDLLAKHTLDVKQKSNTPKDSPGKIINLFGNDHNDNRDDDSGPSAPEL